MPTILIADDSPMVHQMFRKVLTDSEYEIVGHAKDGQEAVELYKARRPDIVTLDITMPIMDGLEALKLIRTFDEHARCLMCSSLDQRDLVLESVRHGAAGYLVKPFDPEEFFEKLRYVMPGENNA